MRRVAHDFSTSAARISTAAALPPSLGTLPTGIETLDALLRGGFPRGGITELTGPASSGRTALLFSGLAKATQQGETVAYIDAFDSFDPLSAAKAGIELNQLLWIRCRSLERALRAGDIVSRAGGFGVIVLDLESPAPTGQTRKGIKNPSYHCWLRLRQAIEGTPTVLLLLARESAAGSLSSLVLTLNRKQSFLQSPFGIVQEPAQGCRLFDRIGTEIRIVRGKMNGHATFCCHFQ